MRLSSMLHTAITQAIAARNEREGLSWYRFGRRVALNRELREAVGVMRHLLPCEGEVQR